MIYCEVASASVTRPSEKDNRGSEKTCVKNRSTHISAHYTMVIEEGCLNQTTVL